MNTYLPTTWQTGDFIVDSKLNKIENRIEEIQNEKNIFYITNPVQDEKGYYYFPNMPSWTDIKNYQDGGIPVIITNGNMRIETRMLMQRNALPFIDPNSSEYANDRGSTSNTDPSIIAWFQGYPLWYSNTPIYIILGVTLQLYEGTWYMNGRSMLYYKTATSHDLYVSRSIPGYTPLPDFPDDNGGNGDVIGPGNGSCGCNSGERSEPTRGDTMDDAGDYACGSSGGSIKYDSGDYSGGGPKKGLASGDYCSGGGANLKKVASGDYVAAT